MVSKGLFITMSDEEAIHSCLQDGVYGQLMKPSQTLDQNYCKILADYLGARPNDHLFFFTNRTIYYGGQLDQATGRSAVFVNSPQNPLDSDTSIEYIPDRHSNQMGDDGIMEVESQYGTRNLHQPFLFSFTDRIGLQGEQITSDKFYNELQRKFAFPLPATEFEGRGFGLLSPAETEILLNQFPTNSQDKLCTPTSNTELSQPLSFDTVPKLNERAATEAQVEASIMAFPEQLPIEIPDNSLLLRQVPVSASRPTVDKVDIAIYDTKNTAFPTHLIELKNETAGKSAAQQIERYIRWAEQIDDYHTPNGRVFAPKIANNFTTHITNQYKQYIHATEFEATHIETITDYL